MLIDRSKSDHKAFLLIRLKKYLNPHENYCSKVISILTTGNILHESSSAPRQHKSVQYKWFTLYLHRDVSHTDMLQLHFISCRGLWGAGGNMRGSRDFCQSYLVLSLLYRGGPLFSRGGGGVKLFLGGGGPNAKFFRNACTYFFSRGVSGPPIPLWIRTWAISS